MKKVIGIISFIVAMIAAGCMDSDYYIIAGIVFVTAMISATVSLKREVKE